jgi:hypothetical protein
MICRWLSLAMVLAILPSAASAQTFEFVFEADGSRYSISRETMRRSGSRVQVWVEQVPERASPTGATFVRSLEIIDCEAMTSKTVAATYYKPSGEVSSSAGEQPLAYAVPGSRFYGFIRRLCSM